MIGGWWKFLVQGVAADRLHLLGSEDLLSELATVLERPRVELFVSAKDAALFRRLYAEALDFIEPGPNPSICRDPRDDYLLALAAAGAADYLVTRDDDLLVLRRYQSTEIIYPARFLQLLAGNLSGG